MKHHIFIVDDEASIRDLLGKFLTGCGYEVTPIETVHEALKSVHKRDPRFDNLRSAIGGW